MQEYPPTIVLRHRKENLNKCSLRKLETRSDFRFFPYPLREIPPYKNYILLTLDAEVELSDADQKAGLLIIDGTWRYAQQMIKNIPDSESLLPRRLPKRFITAYPRRQTDCKDPLRGLASLEAIYCAYFLMKRVTDGLLDHYYWKDSFLEKNHPFLL
jgi:pre-rRNA-processing protein TSR3